MKLHIKIGTGSGTLRDEHDNILAILGWQQKLNAYLITDSEFPELLKQTVRDGYAFQQLVYSKLRTKPTMDIFAPPPENHFDPFRKNTH